MRKKLRIIIVFSFFLCLFFILVVSIINTKEALAQARELEIEYEEIEGLKPETVDFPITSYVKYIFNYMIIGIGLTALWYLLEGGVRFLTSMGKPERLKAARDQILAAFLGIIILLSAYLILSIINPQLLIFQIPGVKLVPPEPTSLPPSVPQAPALYGSVRQIAEQVKLILAGIEDSAQEIKDLTDECDCETTQALCLCDGGSDSSNCNPIKCYAEDNAQPCPDEPEIKKEQQDVIVFGLELLYYRNRAASEKESLLLEITQLTGEKNYFQARENDEREILNTIPTDKPRARENQQRIIDALSAERQNLETEIQLKEDLAIELQRLVDKINEISPPISEIGKLPDKCLYDEKRDDGEGGEYGVNNVCQAHCKGKCHDFKNGCEPDGCDGGNPCPTNDIETEFDNIGSFSGNLETISNEIINKIEEIIIFETR